MPEDRHEPLPSLARLPGFVWARMGRATRAAAVLIALGAVVAVIVLAPKIAENRRQDAARERREAAEFRERRIRSLRELQRPRAGRATNSENPVPELERLITADARSRPRAERVLRTECDPIRGGEGRYFCTAVTSDIPGDEHSRAGVVGYPFRAVARGRRLTWCRIAGQPGEGLVRERGLSTIPTACGG
ncbi:MAG TPA: hypothetical protein VGV10_02590 [Thermoleophilaceae bacterium]|nr:hypothetical protein [Thermoleophilaceae bacterium]